MKTTRQHSRRQPSSGAVNQSRRGALAGIIAGAGLAGYVFPQTWRRPVVESVLLPAHAQTSTISEPEPMYSFTCSVDDIRFNDASQMEGDVVVVFSYTPMDSSGALNGQQVDTTYTARDVNDNIIFGPQFVSNNNFNEQSQPAFPVNPPLPPGPYTVTVQFDDPATYGTASCSSSGIPPN